MLFGKEELARVDIRFDPSMDHLPPVSVPRLPVIHVIYNLIANAIAAIEATGKSNGTIHVHGRHAPGIASIEITDDGIGLSAGLAQGRPGMGLKIMEYRSRMLGGTINFEEPGRGTRIVLSAPLHLLRQSKDRRSKEAASG